MRFKNTRWCCTSFCVYVTTCKVHCFKITTHLICGIMCSIFFHYRLTERQIHGKCGNQIIISSSSLDEHHEVELEDDGKLSSLSEQFVLMIAIQIIHATTLCEKAAIYGTSSVFVLPTHSPIICSVIMFFPLK